ncbi:MAG: HAD family hydrolase [Bacillota bacterium]|nr:HAD family hydrolase [Bacillota bacterium]
MKMIVCDLDGSLLRPSGGLFVSEQVRKKLIQLQEKGVMVVLNSARIFQGIYPLSKQIEMERFGGYIIADNGCQVFDVKTQKNWFGWPISREKALQVWSICQKYELSPAIATPDYVVAKYSTEGYELDMKNCGVNYIFTNNPETLMKEPIWKCTMSASEKEIDENWEGFVREINEACDLQVVRSTKNFVDIIEKNVDKYTANNELLKRLNLSWSDVAAIGDGLPDLKVIAHAGLGVTLENGKEEVKKVAKMIVGHCEKDGCIELFDLLMQEK